MIYEFPKQTDSIRQGDIFIGLPRVDLSLQKEYPDTKPFQWQKVSNGLDSKAIG